MRTILFTGKGGVGKTTLAAATSLVAASRGYRTLVMSTDVAHNLADVLSVQLTSEPSPVGAPNLWGAELDGSQEMERYWGEIGQRITATLQAEGLDGAVAGELSVLPGLDEVLALLRIKRYHDQGAYDVLIVDSAPTGAAMRLLSAPDLASGYVRMLRDHSKGLARLLLPSIQKWANMPWGEAIVRERLSSLFDQIEQLRNILTDPAQTSLRLVLNPETMAVRETQRAYTYMSLYGLSVDALFVNRILPEQVQDPYFKDWKVTQGQRRAQVRDLFAPLPVYEIPLMRQEVMGIEALTSLGETLYAGRDPAERFSVSEPLRFFVRDDRQMMAIRVTGVSEGNIELAKRGDELTVHLGNYRRSVPLPHYLVGMRPLWGRLAGDYLEIAFGEIQSTEGDAADT